jgi:Kef-type K+ transport system membrane component KefB
MLLELDVFTGSPAVWLLAGIFLVLVVVGKTSASWLTAKIYGYSLQELLLMTGLTVPQAAATLAVTVTALEAELFGDDVVDAVIILIFATCFIGPLMARYAGKRLQGGG